MAAADITLVRLREIVEYNPETGVFTWITAGRSKRLGGPAGSVTSRGYARIKIDYVEHQAHRLAWLYYYGAWPKHQIDHINGIKTDNRIANLRDVTGVVNRQNKKRAYKNNLSSGFLGVSRASRGTWQASIAANKKNFYLGTFQSPEIAYAAYLTAKRRLHDGNTL